MPASSFKPEYEVKYNQIIPEIDRAPKHTVSNQASYKEVLAKLIFGEVENAKLCCADARSATSVFNSIAWLIKRNKLALKAFRRATDIFVVQKGEEVAAPAAVPALAV